MLDLIHIQARIQSVLLAEYSIGELILQGKLFINSVCCGVALSRAKVIPVMISTEVSTSSSDFPNKIVPLQRGFL